MLSVDRGVQSQAPGVGGAGSGAAADGGPVSSGTAVASPAAVAAALATKPPPPFTNDPQETSLGVWWQKVEGAEGYRLTYRQFPQDWSTATVCVRQRRGGKLATLALPWLCLKPPPVPVFLIHLPCTLRACGR